MNNKRIKVTLYNRTYKEIDMSDFTCLPEELFANRDDIVEVVLPEGVKVISNNAFENCQRLEKVEFPSTLERIESEAFLFAHLTLRSTFLLRIKVCTFNRFH